MRLTGISLYREPAEPTLRVAEIAAYLGELFPEVSVAERDPLFGEAAAAQAEDWARAKLTGDGTPRTSSPLPMEVEFERQRLADPARAPAGLVYDGHAVQGLAARLLDPDLMQLSQVHVVFTRQLVATPDEGGRYHTRVAVLGIPAVISTYGAVEGPAKPREYYLRVQEMRLLGAQEPSPEVDADQALRLGDERLSEVLKGYAVAAALYQARGEAFCADSRCRLYDAHWQEELLACQLGGAYCADHREVITSLAEGGG